MPFNNNTKTDIQTDKKIHISDRHCVFACHHSCNRNHHFDPDKKILPGNEIKGCKPDTGKHPIADIKSQSVSGKN